MKERYGDQVTIIGMVPPPMIHEGDEDAVRAECRREIDALKKGGGFILSTGCEYPSMASDHLARVIVEEAKTYGRY